MTLRVLWEGDGTSPGTTVRLDEGAYRKVVALEAQRIAGLLVRAELRGDRVSAAPLAAELVALSNALATPTPPRRLVVGETLTVDSGESTWGPRLYAGDAPALWDGLRPRFMDAVEIDVVVAYLTVGGVALVAPTLRRALDAGCRLRILAGCYLGGTRPDALKALRGVTASYGHALVRFVEDPTRHFHPKVYHVVSRDGAVSLFVGSSNLSRDALTGRAESVEWNLSLDDASAPGLLDDARARIEALFEAEGAPLDDAMIARWEKNAQTWLLPPAPLFDVEEETSPVTPNDAQREALARLADIRRNGGTRALVVAPTGVGKTILAALDATAVVPPGKGRILFVAHRMELLTQARRSFERVRGDAGTHGFVHQGEKSTQADHVYASIWSLGAFDDATLARFDYVVIDEAHHGAARSYRALLDRVRGAFVLGLTATPERLDGASIYPLFDGVVAWEATLLHAIERRWLVPFPLLRRTRPGRLSAPRMEGRFVRLRRRRARTRGALRRARVSCVLDAMADPRHAGARTLVFCVTIAHADRTATALRDAKMRVACVHSGPGATARAAAIRDLERGHLDAIVAVDVFNEGVDVPSLDRVGSAPPIRRRCSSSRSAADCVCTRASARSRCSTSLVITAARTRLALLGVTRDEVTRAPPHLSPSMGRRSRGGALARGHRRGEGRREGDHGTPRAAARSDSGSVRGRSARDAGRGALTDGALGRRWRNSSGSWLRVARRGGRADRRRPDASLRRAPRRRCSSRSRRPA
ncbi:MAG: DEAD/DEAH box helicase family protein [Polyangiales bacterium]